MAFRTTITYFSAVAIASNKWKYPERWGKERIPVSIYPT
jgi:hypothetical protein